MNKNLLAGLGVFLAVIIAGIFLIRKPVPIQPIATKGMPVPGSNVSEKIVTDNGTPAREIAVSGNEYSFIPSTITVKKGEKIKIIFTNTGNLPHNLVIDDLNVKTNVIGPGESDSVEFVTDSDSELSYYCSIGGHRDRGMEGKIELSK